MRRPSEPTVRHTPTSESIMSKSSNTQPTSKPRRILPISKSDLARLAGVTKPAITKACKGPLRAAVLSDNNVDSGHPALIEYVRLHQKPKHKPRWISLAQFKKEHGLSDAELIDLLEKLPPDALRLPESAQ